MQLSREYAVTRRITLKLYITMYSKRLNPTLHISLAQSGARIYVFTGEDQQSEWLKRDESNRVYWVETGFLSSVYL